MTDSTASKHLLGKHLWEKTVHARESQLSELTPAVSAVFPLLRDFLEMEAAKGLSWAETTMQQINLWLDTVGYKGLRLDTTNWEAFCNRLVSLQEIQGVSCRWGSHPKDPRMGHIVFSWDLEFRGCEGLCDACREECEESMDEEEEP